MAGRFSIDVAFRAINQITRPMRNMTRSTSAFSKTVSRDFAKAQRSVKNFNRDFSKYMGRGIAIGSGIAIAAVAKLTSESTKLWDTQAQAIESINATLQSTGSVAGRSLQQITSQASKLQKDTFFGDEDILNGVSSQLLTFTNIQGTAFDRASAAVLDVTAKLRGINATETDLQSTTLQLAKALNDPVANLGALSRSGIQFSDKQKTLIKSLAQSGKMFEAQNIILTEIEKQYGGTAGALAKTAGGMKKQTQNMIGDLLEMVGKGVEPLRLAFLQIENQILPKVAPLIEKLANKILTINTDELVTTVVDGFEGFVRGVKNALSSVKKFLPLIKSIGTVILTIIGIWKIYQTSLKIAAAAQMIFNTVMAGGPLLPFIGIALIVIGVIGLLRKNWDKITNAVHIAWVTVKTFAEGILNTVIPYFKALGRTIFNYASIPINILLTGISALLGVLSKLPGKAGDAFRGAADAVKDFQAGMNQTLTGTEGLFDYNEGRSRENGDPRRRVITQSERISRSYSESVNRSEITVRNDGTTNVDTDSGVVAPGQRIILPSTG